MSTVPVYVLEMVRSIRMEMAINQIMLLCAVAVAVASGSGGAKAYEKISFNTSFSTCDKHNM